MRHSIDLSNEAEQKLQEIARETGISEKDLLRETVAALLTVYFQDHAGLTYKTTSNYYTQIVRAIQSGDLRNIRVTDGVMGGDACIRNTRIPVWLLVQYKRQGMTDSELLQSYPSLNASDLSAAWDYFAAYSSVIEEQLRQHEEAA